jgi:hypothetical protein
MGFRTAGALSALAIFAAGAANAATDQFTATLTGAAETPPNATTGTGSVKATFDTTTKLFKYKVTYSGLTGPALAAHFHGPADPGVAAGVEVPVSNTANPMGGSATLTDAQAADLEAGKIYFNIHTAANKGGEIRGQLVKKP